MICKKQTQSNLILLNLENIQSITNVVTTIEIMSTTITTSTVTITTSIKDRGI